MAPTTMMTMKMMVKKKMVVTKLVDTAEHRHHVGPLPRWAKHSDVHLPR